MMQSRRNRESESMTISRALQSVEAVWKKLAWMVLHLIFASLSVPASAGPPYATDDPGTPEAGQFEGIAFVSGERVDGGLDGGFGLDMAYGITDRLQMSVVVPMGISDQGRTYVEPADLEIGASYRFLEQHSDSLLPAIAFAPAVSLPTGTDRFSAGRVTAFLPVWAQKDFGSWSLFGGGGYGINPGQGNRDYLFTGIGLSRQVTERLSLGAEIYHTTSDEAGGNSTSNIAFGVEYALSARLALLASTGPFLSRPDGDRAHTFFIGISVLN